MWPWRQSFLPLFALTSCGDNRALPDAPPPPPRIEVALVPIIANPEVDILFVLQKSCCTLDKQLRLRDAFPALIEELSALPDGLPSLHIGSVTTHLGTKAANSPDPAPSLGPLCEGTGDRGALYASGSPALSGNFIADTRNSDGTRATNYTGSVVEAYGAIGTPGATGCGFAQHLEAARLALDDHPENVGFLRPGANLALVVLAEDEDCSVADPLMFTTQTDVLGPVSSFRCVRFGVTCDEGGRTPDEMNEVGVKTGCHSNESSPYSVPVGVYESFLKGLKADPRSVMVAAIAGEASHVEVILSSPPGGGEPIPRVSATCSIGNDVAEPTVRIAQLARSFARHVVADSCNPDFTDAATAIARQIRGMTGDTCLSRDIAQPADCEVADQRRDGSETMIPPCDGVITTNCYRLVPDASCRTSQQLRVDVTRTATPPADTMIAVRCRL